MLKEEIHNSYDTIEPDEETKKRMLQNIQSGKKHSKFIEKETKRLFRFAPVLAVVIIVTTVSCTSYFFSLRDLGLGKEEIQIIILPQQEAETGYNNPPQQTTEVDIIALGGVWNSPEYKACAEWEEFLQNYDQDGSIIASIGIKPTGLEESYDAYLCYTQEMADKIEEICEKYHLSKLTGFQIADDIDTLCRLTGVGNVLGDVSEHAQLSFEWGYLYSDGTFHMEGTATISDTSQCTTDFQFVRSMKGSFSSLTLNVTDISQYRQWNYTTQSGVKVLLANSSTKALIIVEREKSFIVVNVLGDILSDTFDISDEALEMMADAFDFSVIP
ncbi:MAG: hypothetical protein K2N44_05695 [Lachnospiraceae bacterium]|nr:hypothetical protein [Lachnospiraceae bacterium]